MNITFNNEEEQARYIDEKHFSPEDLKSHDKAIARRYLVEGVVVGLFYGFLICIISIWLIKGPL
ncbi:MAG: hypothetical protein PHW75_00485 [Patescibacteria group bacterium]|nr:hypothetical protein [Patescibacteria group bacterium]